MCDYRRESEFHLRLKQIFSFFSDVKCFRENAPNHFQDLLYFYNAKSAIYNLKNTASPDALNLLRFRYIHKYINYLSVSESLKLQKSIAKTTRYTLPANQISPNQPFKYYREGPQKSYQSIHPARILTIANCFL